MNEQRYDEQIIKKLEDLILEFVRQVSVSTPPVLTHINRTTWENVDFNSQVGLCMKDENVKLTSVRFDSWKSVNKLRMLIKVISMIHQLMTSGRYATKRDLYYQDAEGIGSQPTLDDAVDNVSCMLQIPRWHLHILATSKGCVAGNLSFLDADGSYVDCSKTKNGILVPSHIEALQQVHTTARFLLIVEKDAVFQKLLDDNFCEHMKPCILVTGKGFPDINTRMLLNRIWRENQLPMAILVDADSYGIEIMCVYKFGSRSLSFEAKFLTVPTINWLGILPSDIDRLAVPKER
ncbi:hypothetical protein FSP39_013385 [Pinctada imbricata]|uniref:DNA topoisomerase (ATP-hydrolyzing) n=1 Tax=Pinctada imbricata TaxID=66713 RepID=A0AA89BKH9_PINIB|nr:hypothetical protein FSP39_013385 [Pinctada imbricata]